VHLIDLVEKARLPPTISRPRQRWWQTYCGLGSLEGGTAPFIRM
jgi:hypothetical protein